MPTPSGTGLPIKLTPVEASLPKGEGQPSAGSKDDIPIPGALPSDKGEGQPSAGDIPLAEFEDAPWVSIEEKGYNPLYNERSSRFLTHLLRHDRKAPIKRDGGCSYEYLRSVCRKGSKHNFHEDLLANLAPEKGNICFQVQYDSEAGSSE